MGFPKLSGKNRKHASPAKIDKDAIADMLKTTPEALDAFEQEYRIATMDSKPGRKLFNTESIASSDNASVVNRIVDEFAACADGKSLPCDIVTPDDIDMLPESERPQCTPFYMSVDIPKDSEHDGGMVVLDMYRRFRNTDNAREKQMYYGMFRQGLDILDLDPIIYEVINTNPNSMGFWLPEVEKAVAAQSFFKTPETVVRRMPMSILNLVRSRYGALTQATKDVVNRVVFQMFDLDEDKSYFVKTGTFSCKYDFRNCVVRAPQEVRELGEYLLYINFFGLQMCNPLNGRSIYGATTTNEWVVREYIEDKENCPQIYHGMPLHTEYRVFVDFDNDKVLSCVPYWNPDAVLEHFRTDPYGDTVDGKHDYAVFKAYSDTMMERYKNNKDEVVEHVSQMIPSMNLPGQWSIDVMQNDDDFWIIDMAIAQNSAFYDTIPAELRNPSIENWIPMLPPISEQND